MPTYLFIPFEKKEDSKELLGMAERWADAQLRHKLQLCEIVAYKEDSIPKLTEGDVIYVLAHGVLKELLSEDLGSNYITNTGGGLDSAGIQNFLTPSALATRMLEAGLTPKSGVKIKLFFCDEQEIAKEIAQEFMQELIRNNENFKNSGMKLGYYSGILSAPIKTDLQGRTLPIKNIHKHAARHAGSDDKNVIKMPRGNFVYLGRASSVRTDLLFGNPKEEKKQTEVKKDLLFKEKSEKRRTKPEGIVIKTKTPGKTGHHA